MIIEQTEIFKKWFTRLKDENAKALIAIKIQRIKVDNHFGDCKSVGGKIFELRIHYGPGYRVYFYKHHQQIVMLLCGGNKSTQDNDISKAQQILEGIKQTKYAHEKN